MATARVLAEKSGARITITDDLDEGLSGADFVSTDVWVSMGEPKEVWAQRIADLKPYRVDAHQLERTGNSAVKLMHCLPAYRGYEVAAEVIDGSASRVIQQGHNRLHASRGVLAFMLGVSQ